MQEENKEEQITDVEEKRKHRIADYGFKKTEELGGVIDYKINVNGRPSYKKMTNKQIREKELLLLLRKLKPHVASAIATAVKIMSNSEATDQNKLRAATLILQQYKDTMESAYDKEYDADEGEEINQESTPVFSLKVLNDDSSENKT